MATITRAAVGEDISDLVCWTCSEAVNNKECNKWAPDVPCPVNTTVCQTMHRFDNSGRSQSVIKMCVHQSRCSYQNIGCHWIEDTSYTECLSCCRGSYCNEAVPTSLETALNLSATLVMSDNSMATITKMETLIQVVCIVLAFIELI